MYELPLQRLRMCVAKAATAHYANSAPYGSPNNGTLDQIKRGQVATKVSFPPSHYASLGDAIVHGKTQYGL